MAVIRKPESRTLSVWHPFRDLEEMERNIGRRFSDTLGGYDWWRFPSLWGRGPRTERLFMPKVDMIEKPDKYLLRIELPGMKKEDIDLSITQNMLLISGEKKADTKEEKESYVYREHSYGAFRRLVELPSDVDTTKIEASYEGGILEVTLLKGKEVKAKKIPVRSKEETR